MSHGIWGHGAHKLIFIAMVNSSIGIERVENSTHKRTSLFLNKGLEISLVVRKIYFLSSRILIDFLITCQSTF